MIRVCATCGGKGFSRARLLGDPGRWRAIICRTCGGRGVVGLEEHAQHIEELEFVIESLHDDVDAVWRSRRRLDIINKKLRAELHDLAERAAELAQENDRLYRLPTLDWARAKSAFLQTAASIARQGVDAKPLAQTLDALGSYVTRLEAEADDLREALRPKEGEER